MVYRSISPDMKRRALQLLDEGWKGHKIAKILSVSSESIEQWHDNYETKGRVDPPSFLRGRRRILSAGAIAGLHELIQENPELFLDEPELRLWLALYHDIQISTTALQSLHNNLRQLHQENSTLLEWLKALE